MLKIIFYIKSEKTKINGESPIFAKISNKQDSITLSTGKSILNERWIFTNKLRNVLKLEKEKVTKQTLDLLHIQIERKFNGSSNHSFNTSISRL